MYLEAEVWTVARTEKGNAVLLRPLTGQLAVPIFIGALEAQNILLGMGEVEIPRPLSHDLMLTILRTLGGELVQVEVHAIREGTFYARLIVNAPGGHIPVDSRPSDALALAVRAGCKVFIDDSIVEEVGIPLSSVRASQGEELPSPAETPEGPSEKEILEKALQRAVDDENYEEAARIRDKLRDWLS